MKTKIASVIFCLLASITLSNAEIHSGYCGDQVNGTGTNIRWSLNTEDSTLTLTGSGKMYAYTYGYQNPWKEYKSYIKYLVFDGKITTITQSAFEGDSALVSAILPKTNVKIYEKAFANCVSLKHLSFNSDYIGKQAFYNCTSLDSISIKSVDPYIGKAAFFGCPAVIYGLATLNTSFSNDVFFGAINIILPGTVPDSAKWGALCINGYEEDSIIYQNSTKTHVAACRRNVKSPKVLPQSVTTIGKNAFAECKDLPSVLLTDNITTIRDAAFKNCCSLTSFTFPSSLTSIGLCPFEGCRNLNSVIWDAYQIPTMMVVDNSDMYKFSYHILYDVLEQIEDFTIGSNIRNITPYMLSGMIKLQSIIIPENVINIGERAFSGCVSLANIEIPSNVVSIGDSACYRCNGVLNITISNGVLSIGNGAFCECSKLTSLIIPQSITRIGKDAFEKCTAISSITWLPKNYKFSLDSCSSPFWGIRNQIESFILGEDVTSIPAYLCYGMKNLSSIDLPMGITTIDTCAFRNCSSLASITIPDGVTSIKYAAFAGCASLGNIQFPDNLTSIEGSSFSGCTSLTNIHIPDNITSIEGSVFAHCKKLETIHLPKRLISIGPLAFKGDSALSSLTLPNSLTSIGKSAFMDCESLYSLKIPDKVTKLEDSTFSGCSLLNKVIIGKKVASLGEKVFEKCYNIDALTCLPTNPPSTKPNSVPSWSKLVVYVPAGSVSLYPRYSNQHWSSCREIRALPQAENVDVTGVTATAISDDSVSITWLHVLNAETYIVEVVLEGYSTITLYFTNNGIQYNTQYSRNDLYYAPVHERVSRRTQTELLTSASGWKFIIGDLIPEETYAYKITAINTDGDTISTQSGSFRMVVQYQISFINYDGTELQSGMVDKGVLPVYSGEIPTRPNDEQYTYTFKGWYPEVVAVTGPATYMAKFEAVEIPGTTDLKDVGSKNVIVQKFTKDGQIFILRGDKTYTITGAEVR